MVDRFQGEIGLEEVKKLLEGVRERKEIERRAWKSAEKQEHANVEGRMRAYRRGVVVQGKGRCEVCGKSILDLCVFRQCGHHLHLPCSSKPDVCPLCQPNPLLS